VHQIEDERIPIEEEGDSPWCACSYYHTLGQRLQENGRRHHGYPQFRPSTKQVNKYILTNLLSSVLHHMTWNRNTGSPHSVQFQDTWKTVIQIREWKFQVWFVRKVFSLAELSR
jgi:hypothetical protein